MEKYNGAIQYVAILIAFLLPLVLAAKLYFFVKIKQYSITDLLTAAAYIILITIAFVLLNNAQRLYLAVYLGLVTVAELVLIVARRLVKR